MSYAAFNSSNIVKTIPVGFETAGAFEQFWVHMTTHYPAWQIAVFGSFILHTIVYLVFTAISVTIACMPFLDKYKIQKTRHVTWTNIVNCFGAVQFTHCLLEVCFLSLSSKYYFPVF